MKNPVKSEAVITFAVIGAVINAVIAGVEDGLGTQELISLGVLAVVTALQRYNVVSQRTYQDSLDGLAAGMDRLQELKERV